MAGQVSSVRTRGTCAQMIRQSRQIIGLLCLILSIFLSAAQVKADDEETAEEQDEAQAMVVYEVEFNTPDIEGVGDLIEQSSQLVQLEDNPPASIAGLRRRAEADVERFEDVMKSLGYYDSQISFDVAGDQEPAVVTVTIEPGQQYVVAAFDIAYLGGPPARADSIPNLADINVTLGSPAVADAIIGAEARVVRYLRNRGYPFASADERLVLADHGDRTIWVQVSIEPGAFVRFGETEISGIDRTEAAYFVPPCAVAGR